MSDLKNVTAFDPHPLSKSAVPGKDWTVMIYLAGDNNLSDNMAHSLESLGRLAASFSEDERSRINLLAYFSGSCLTAPAMYLDYSDFADAAGPVRQPMTPDLKFHRTAEQPAPDEESAGDDLLNFIRWCVDDENGRGRTARNYALILSGHSLGFHGTTFLRDDSSGKYFTLESMRRALEKANELYLTNDEDGRLAILGFDSCVMSMVEVGYEFKNVARTLIASEGSLPNSGWGYAPMISHFVSALANGREKANRSPDENKRRLHETARSFVRSFTEFYKELAIGGGSIDIAAWDLDQVETLASQVGRLGEELNSILSRPSEPAFRELKKIILQSHYDSQTYMADQYLDIKDFCERLIDECGQARTAEVHGSLEPIVEACRNLINAVDKCVLKCGFSGDAYQFSNGISMYFPWSSVAFALTDTRYRMLSFVMGESDANEARGPGRDWYSFLLNYVGNVTVRKSRKQSKNWGSKLDSYGSIYQIQTPNSAALPALTKDGWSSVGLAASSKSSPPFYKGFADTGSYMLHFGRFKNYELGWDISGYADDPTGQQ